MKHLKVVTDLPSRENGRLFIVNYPSPKFLEGNLVLTNAEERYRRSIPGQIQHVGPIGRRKGPLDLKGTLEL